MQLNNYIQTKIPFFVALSFTFLLASCGSYQYVGSYSDGIYSDDEVVYEEAPSREAEANSVYKDYFDEKAEMYNTIPDDGSAIFTDIDSYVGNYDETSEAEEVPTGNAGWGQDSDHVSINVINTGWNTWGWNAGWGWNNWGWNRWGFNGLWNRPFWNVGLGWGWNNWGWNVGWNAWNPGWGWGYNTWCPPGYYYGNNNLAFNYGRRGSNLSRLNRNRVNSRNLAYSGRRNSTALNNRRATSFRPNSSNSRISRSINNSRIRTNSRSNNTRIRPSGSTRRPATRSNNSRVRPSGTSTRRPTTRSNNSRVRSNSSSTRRSPAVRRSSGSSRSSGSMRSGGSSRSSGSSRGGSSRGGSGRRG
ncbi:hypothetical protein [uncultured Psychroserpens sp.]|uniref:hypothetical protein n=1 Tax=uncultured Psychroserpens sp. TaxID=255436 RepID=UPI00260B6038|nr:hypothetical protein [uncultured Psychroserpens sp.]